MADDNDIHRIPIKDITKRTVHTNWRLHLT